MTAPRKFVAVLAIVLVLLTSGAAWIVATESGTRWLLARLEGRLPAELSLGTLRGSLLDGIRLDSMAWRSAALELSATALEIDFRLAPLLRRQLIITELNVARLQLLAGETAAEDQGEAGVSVDLPIEISLLESSFKDIEFTRGDLQRVVERVSIAAGFGDRELRLSSLEFRSAWLDLDLAGSMVLTEDWPLDINTSWTWKEQEPERFSGRLQVSGNVGEYRLQHVLDAPLAITTTGTLDLTGESPGADLLSRWTSMSWPLGERTLHASEGSLRLTGGLDEFLVEIDTGVRVDEYGESHVRLSGNAQWTPWPLFDLAYDVTGLDPAMADERLHGALASQGTLTLAIIDGHPDIVVGIKDLEGPLNGYPVDGRATVRNAKGQTTIRDATVNLGDNTLRGEASFGETMRIDAAINFVDLGQIAADSAGSINGRVTIGGNLENPNANVDLQGADIVWREHAVARFDADVFIKGDQLGSAEVTIEGATIASADIDFARVSMSGRPASHNLQSSARLYGNSLDIAGSGSYAASAWTLDLERVSLANEPMGTWSSGTASRLVLGKDQGQLQRTCLVPVDGTGQACVAANYAAGTTSIDVTVDSLPLLTIPLKLPPGITVDGLVNASVRAATMNQQLTAEASVDLQGARIAAVYDDEQIAIDATEATGSARLFDGRLESSARIELADDAGSASARLAVRDAGDGNYPVDGRADVMISDASVFAVFLPSINKPRGRLEGGLTVTGDASAPEFVGEINIRDGAFGVRQTGIEVSGVNLRVAQSQPGQVELQGSAQSGDGILNVEGITRVSRESGVRSEIRLRGEDFELARLPDWQISASPSITAVFDNYITTIVGQLTIPSAEVMVREIPEGAQRASPDSVVHRQGDEEPARRRRIDLHLRTTFGEDVRFSGFGLTTGLEGAIQLRGGTHAPYTGQGSLTLVNGRYKAYGQELEIERGNLIFTGPLDEPLLDIRAIRRTPDVIAGIQLSGTPSRLQSSVFSEPAVSDAETLSYLLTGRPLSTAMSSGEEDTLSQAAFALGLSGAGLITSQIRSQLGLETLTIEGTREDSRLVAGKRLGDRLLVEYGYGLVDKLGTLLLRYQINDRIMLESRSGTVSTLDLLYRARKK